MSELKHVRRFARAAAAAAEELTATFDEDQRALVARRIAAGWRLVLSLAITRENDPPYVTLDIADGEHRFRLISIAADSPQVH